MSESLSAYWAQLIDSVHPNDTATFDRVRDHGFNLEFPPPAFIGDILNAPIIILDNNGGYDHTTPREFPDDRAREEYRSALKTPRQLNPNAASTSPYYLRRNFSRWLITGEAALINGVAYRSKDGNALGVKQLTRELPSALFHQRWLRETLAPLAMSGERFVVIHRWGRWNRADDVLRGVQSTVRSRAPIGGDLTSFELAAAQEFLRLRR